MKKRILFSREVIAERTAELGRTISDFYRDAPLTVVTLMNGGMIFAADLIRNIDVADLRLDSFAASSYENDASSGNLKIRSNLKLSVEGRHVLLVDDILDTGCTLKHMEAYFLTLKPLSVRSCVLLNKILNPGKTKSVDADWIGFAVQDLYVIGYGLDSRESYRNLPEISVIEPDE